MRCATLAHPGVAAARAGPRWRRRLAAGLVVGLVSVAYGDPECAIYFGRSFEDGNFPITVTSKTDESMIVNWESVTARTRSGENGRNLTPPLAGSSGSNDYTCNQGFTWANPGGNYLEYFYAIRTAPVQERRVLGAMDDPSGTDPSLTWACVSRDVPDGDPPPPPPEGGDYPHHTINPESINNPFGYVGADDSRSCVSPVDNVPCELQPYGTAACEESASWVSIRGLQPSTFYDIYVSALVEPSGARQTEESDVNAGEHLAQTRMYYAQMGRLRANTYGPPDRPAGLKAGRFLPDGTFEPADERGYVESDGSVALQWNDELEDYDQPIIGFEYQFRLRGSAVFGEDWTPTNSQDSELSVTGLEPGQRYVFRVRAINAQGSGASASVEAVAAMRPELDLLEAEVLGDGDGKVQLTWAVADLGGLELVNFEYRYERVRDRPRCADVVLGEDTIWRDAGRTLGAGIEGLANGEEYRFEVRARTDFGPGDPLSICYSVGRVPYAPVVHVEAIARGTPAGQDGHGFGITWQRALNGGFRIDLYEYFVAPGDEFDEDFPNFPDDVPADEDGRWTVACGRAQLREVTDDPCPFRADIVDLEYATEYQLLFRAENEKGKGTLRTGRITTLPGAPDPPEEVQVTARDGAIELAWVAGSDNGAEIVAYQYRYRAEDADATDVWSRWRFAATGDATTFVAVGLTNGTRYEIELRAINATGFGQAVAASGTPVPGAALRGIVKALAGERLDSSHADCTGSGACVTLTWQPPDGEPPTRYEWTSGDGRWESIPVSQCTVSEDMATTVCKRVVTGLTAGTAYVFAVRAVTPSGGTGPARSVTVTPGVVPGSVPDLSAVAGDAEVRLTWGAATATGGPILRYEYRFRAPAGVWSRWAIAGLAQSATVEGLTNGIEYDFSVRAVNALGAGDAVVVAKTPTANPTAGAPGNLVVEVGEGVVTLAWPPSVDSDGNPVDEYLCRYRPVGGAAWFACKAGGPQVCLSATQLADLDVEVRIRPGAFLGSDPGVAVAGLTNGVAYEFEVRACKDGRASDPSRAEATPVVTALAPGPPEGLVGQRGNGRVTLRWAVAASNDGVAVTGYEFRWRRVGGEFGPWTDACQYPPGDTLRSRCGQVLEWTVESLVNGTRLHFEVRARKGELAGPVAAVWITPAAVPNAPLDLRHTVGNGEMSVVWRPPADGGAAVTGYEYRVRAGGGEFGDWAPVDDRLIEAGDRFTLLLVGLRTDEVGYTVEVRAVNDVGEGPAVSVASTPGAVTEAALSAVAGDGEVELRWPATSESDVVRYQFRCTPEAAGCTGWVDALDLLRRVGAEFVVTIGGLENGRAYTFELRAVDANGPRPPDSAMAIPAGVPGPPVLSVTAGDGEAVLTWQAPADDGGAAVARYEISYSVAGGPFGSWQSVTGEGPVTLGGLANGEEHVFGVRAVNSAGAGTPARLAATPAGVPSAPLELATERGDGSVTLRWRAPATDGGVAIRGYEVRFRRGDEADFGAWVAVGPVTEHTVAGLANGVAHLFDVRAANAVFTGEVAQTSATPGGTPGAPKGLATQAGDGRVSLTWQAPDEDGGLEIVRYEARAGAPDQQPGEWKDVGLDLRTTFDGLTNGVTYFLEVRAVNAEGGGTVASALGTPWVATVPAAPALTARGDDGRAVLSWNVPDNGGDAIVRFEYRWRVEGESFGEWVDAALTTGAVVGELVNGTAYAFEVRAVNGVGAGDPGTASATPAGLPGAPSVEARGGPEEVVLTWQGPDDTGGLRINLYEYRWREQSGTFGAWNEAGLDFGATVRGLRNGTPYILEVRAVNDKGAGAAATATATPAPGVEDAVLAAGWLSRFGRVSSGHVVEALQERFEQQPRSWSPRPGAREPSRPESGSGTGRPAPESERVRHRGGVGGRTSESSRWQDGAAGAGGWPDLAGPNDSGGLVWDRDGRGSADRVSGDLRDFGRVLASRLAPGDAFLLSATPGGRVSRVSAWGRLSTAGFEGTGNLASVDGRVRTVTLGGDVEFGAGLAGLAVSHSGADGGFEFLGGGGTERRRGDDAESALTGVYPYARFGGERVSLWGVAGNAQGSMALTGSGVSVEANIAAGMAAAGLRGLWLASGAFEVAVKSDVLRTWLSAEGERLDEVDAAVNRLRLLLEASASSGLAGGRLTSSVEFGLRHDSGSADAGGGLEVGGGFRFAGARRLSLGAQGRAVVAHAGESFGEWGLSGSVLYAPRAGGVGASLRLVPAWGTTGSGVDELWAAPERWLPRRTDPAFGMDAKFGYGFRARRSDAVTGPYVATGYRHGAWMRRVGWRLSGGTLRLDGAVFHRDAARGGVGVLLRASMGR